jgi:hypothetical protein
MTSLACLSRRSFLSDSDRIALLFLMPGNEQSLIKQMQIFELATQQVIWVQNYGQSLKLNVKFLTGSSEQKKKIQDVVNKKINQAHFMNVQFEFVDFDDEMAQIRITFYENQHSWSFLGTEALLIDESLPTMNLSELSEGNILHQFAHCLGFSHMQKYIPGGIHWNKPQVNKAFAGPPHFWNTAEEMESNFYDIYNLNQFYNYKNFQENSLMLNIWPCSFLKKPPNTFCDRILQNDYSQEDKDFFRSFYPFLEKNQISSSSIQNKSNELQSLQDGNDLIKPIPRQNIQTCKSASTTSSIVIGLSVIVILAMTISIIYVVLNNKPKLAQ